MMSFLQISMLLLMACCFTKSAYCQQSFSVQVLSPRLVNNVTIRCEEINGNAVTDGVVFYRNGMNQDEDQCLSAGEKLDNGKFMLQVSPRCEGHYMCGTSNSNGIKLSGPNKLYAFPQHVPESNTINRMVIKRLGDDANLPCSVERNALEQVSVQWTRISTGASETFSVPPSGDYNLTLKNLTFENAGTYSCSVTSLNLQGLDRTLIGLPIKLQVAPNHIPPKFTELPVYEQKRGEFMVTVEGSAGLMVQWFINGRRFNNASSTQLPNNMVQSRLQVRPLMGNSRITVIASNVDTMTGERFRTRTTVLALFGSQLGGNSSYVNSCPGATPGVIAPVVILCLILTSLLFVAGLAILIILLKQQSKPKSSSLNPISSIFTNVGMFLQQNPQSDLMDLNVLEGLSQAVGTILNKENLTLTNKALECMENVKSSLEATKTVIRRQRREMKKVASVESNQTVPPMNKFASKGVRKELSNPDSGIESAGGSTQDSLEEVYGAYEEIKDEEMQKVDDLHEAVTLWLKKCRVLKRQNAVTDTNTLDTAV